MVNYPVYNSFFSAFAFLGFFVCCISLPWQFQTQNSGACLYAIWVAVGCFNQFVNSVVWNGNAINWAPVWCDISSHITIGISVAIPACGLCITRRMWRTMKAPSSYLEEADRRRALWIDLAIGIGLPFLFMILYYIPQGHRFDILEDIGCVPTTYMTAVGVIFVYLPPVLIALTSCVYSVLAIHSLLQVRRTMSSNSGDSLDGRYMRLLILGVIDACLSTPFTFIFFIINILAGVSPWISWEDTHFNFSRVLQVPGVLWRGDSTSAGLLELSRWLNVFSAFVFFGLFGLARQARENYKQAALSTWKTCASAFGSRRNRRSSGDLAETIRIVELVGRQGQSPSMKKVAPWDSPA